MRPLAILTVLLTALTLFAFLSERSEAQGSARKPTDLLFTHTSNFSNSGLNTILQASPEARVITSIVVDGISGRWTLEHADANGSNNVQLYRSFGHQHYSSSYPTGILVPANKQLVFNSLSGEATPGLETSITVAGYVLR